MYKNNIFHFDTVPEIDSRSEHIKAMFGGRIFVCFGGIVLPAKVLVPKQVRYEVKTRNWFGKELSGAKDNKRTERRNKDGSITVTEVVSYVELETGASVQETSETTYDPNYNYYLANGQNPFESLASLYEHLTPTNRGSYTVTVSSSSPKQFPKQTIRTTRTKAPGATVEQVVQRTEVFDPTQTGTGVIVGPISSVTDRWTEEVSTEPKVFAKPVIKTAVTGKQYKQWISSSNIIRDENYFNENMKSNPGNLVAPTLNTSFPNGAKGQDTVEIYFDTIANVKITKTMSEDVDPDGNRTTRVNKVIEPYINQAQVLEQIVNESGTQITTNTKESPVKENNVVETYNFSGALVRRVTTDTTRTPITEETENTEENLTDGTKTESKTTRTVDAQGNEIVQATEKITKAGTSTTTTRSDAINYDEGIRTITLRQQVVDNGGDTRETEKVFRYNTATTFTSIEKVNQTFEDALANELVYGNIIKEFEIRGEVLESGVTNLLHDKYAEHQMAWAMHDVLEEQLGMGDRFSPAYRKKLYAEQLQIFSGNNPVGAPMRGGPVLDRIYLEVLGEVFSEGCVFAPQNGFKVEWIPGTDRMYSWSINVQIYSRVVKNTDAINTEGWNFDNLNLPPMSGVYNKEIT